MPSRSPNEEWTADLERSIEASLTASPRLKQMARAAGLDFRLDLCRTDFREADLDREDLSGMNLSGANFSGAVLTGCNLRRSNLSRADFTHAKIKGARFEGADLTGAKGLPGGRRRTASVDQLPGNDADMFRLAPIQAAADALLRDEVRVGWFVVWELGHSATFARIVASGGNVADCPGGRLDFDSPLVNAFRTGAVQVVNVGASPLATHPRLLIPVSSKGHTLGVIEIGRNDAGADLSVRRADYSRAASVLAVTWTESHRLAALQGLGRALRGQSDPEAAMIEIEEVARRATLADLAAFSFRGKEREGTRVFVHSSPATSDPDAIYRLTTSASHKLNGAPVFVGDLERGEGWSPESPLVVRSLAVAEIRHLNDSLGVLVVEAARPGHFDGRDLSILAGLAGLASSAFGGPRVIEYLKKIEDAVSGLGRAEELYRSICTRLTKEFMVDFAALQRVSSNGAIVETVAGSGVAEGWVGRSRHPLAHERRLRDIQADIVISGRGEILRGADDPRLDMAIFQEHHHKDFVRLFVPLVIFRNAADGQVLPDLSATAQWRLRKVKGFRARKYALILRPPPGTKVQVLGTIEAGIASPRSPVDESSVLAFAKQATLEALELYRATLPCALAQILEATASVAGADSATLHFVRRRNGNFVIEMVHGKRGATIMERQAPRRNGLGMHALRNREPMALSGAELRRSNRRVWNEGVRAMIAFPLFAGTNRVGILYAHFNKEREFSRSELKMIGLVAAQAADAIRLATEHEETCGHERLRNGIERASEALDKVLASLRELRSRRSGTALIEDARQRLLGALAANAKNILAADVVTIHEYEGGKIRSNPIWAGRLLRPEAMRMQVKQTDVPYRIVEQERDVTIAVDAHRERLLHGIKKRAGNFVEREHIRSTAAVRLQIKGETVGVMFVNYRRRHEFTLSERSLLQVFASSAARFIKHGRDLIRYPKQARNIGRQVRADYESLMNTASTEPQPTSGPAIGHWSLPSITDPEVAAVMAQAQSN